MSQKHSFGPMTRLIHGKIEDQPSFKRSHVNPVIQTSTFRYRNVKEGEEIFSGNTLHDAYSRISNPNHRELEEKLCILEEGEAAQVFDSGMSAVKVAIQSLVKSGDHIVAHRNLYGGTINVLEDLRNFNIRTSYVDACYSPNVLRAVTPWTKIIFLESPSNPMLDIIDFSEISGMVKAAKGDCIVIIDSTFGTPINQKPLKWGADIVIHSLTKYLNGFGTYIGGAIVTSEKMMDRIWERYHGSGGMMDPRVASDISHNILSIYDRMNRHNANAERIASFLFMRYGNLIKKTYYPGNRSHRNYEIASRLMTGYGGMISLELIDPDGLKTIKFLDKLAEDQYMGLGIISQAVSLGSVDSLITCPARSTHLNVPRQHRLNQGLPDNLIRLSVGIEDVEDIKYSLNRAFEII